ncbi:MAG: cytochrome c3 family protein [Desulfuromonadaceae bacterium]|nr:cytochrome c3 family protein [Desulfuromonadaceae bacterium]
MRIIVFDSAKKARSVKRRLLLCGLLLTGGLTLTAVFAGSATQAEERAGAQCIQCHVEVYDSVLKQPFIHSPFFEQQCPTCHLQPGSDWGSDAVTAAGAQITGSRVSQQTLWRKQQLFGGELRTKAHQASISNLQPEAVYRFRLQVAEEQSQPFSASLWLGLRPDELLPTESREILLEDAKTGRELPVSKLNIASVAVDTLLISWETEQPFFSWLELQELDGVEATPSGNGEPSRAGHPPLRDPVEMAISACYQCHSESSLGTSHPVRLYNGRDVRIPEELPTVGGMLTCVTCHDPHGAPGVMLVREVIKTKLCVTCHYKFKNSSPSTMFR